MDSQAEKLDDDKPENERHGSEHSSATQVSSPNNSDQAVEPDTERAVPDPRNKEKTSQGDQDAEKQAFLVKWDADEKANPRNFSHGRKAFITFQLGMLALAASLGSSIIAPAEPALAEYLGLSEEITILTISLYVLGFAFGYASPSLER